MLVPLRITTKSIDILKKYEGQLLLPRTKSMSDAFYKGLLEQTTGADGIIDGSDLKALNFPFDRSHYDVFISYSHNDEKYAGYLYSYLTKCGLRCFLDSTIWNSADALLEAIDEQYCKENGSYSYSKSNFSTSHVHAMLSMAMLEAVNRSECCILIQSENSVTLGEGIDNKTLSPWIYEEISFIQHIERQLPPRLKSPSIRIFCEGAKLELRDSTSNSLKVSYDVDLNDFKLINSNDLRGKRGMGLALLDEIYINHNIRKAVIV